MGKESPFNNNRRKFIKGVSLALGTTALGIPLVSLGSCQSGNSANTEEQPGQDTSQKKKLGIALVGLGNYST
ncbi:twin-arginine translocation signal domain-containing protein, partial [Pontibacter silvestris]